MFQQDDDDADEASHPRETAVLFGHAAAEAALLAAYRAGRMPHGILIAGPKGIGKATLAYRIARFVLSHPDSSARNVQHAVSLDVDPATGVARRIAAQAQPDLLVIERIVNERGVLRNQIAVDDIRRTVPFFGSTAGEGGWRIAIIDAVDDLNRSAANAGAAAACCPFDCAGAANAAVALPHHLTPPLGAGGRRRRPCRIGGYCARRSRHYRGCCRRRWLCGSRADFARRGRFAPSATGARSLGPPARSRSHRFARAWRRLGRNRSATVGGVSRHRQWLALAAA